MLLLLAGGVVLIGLGILLYRALGGRLSRHRDGLAERPQPFGSRSESEIYRLAQKLGGRLTVSDVVIHPGFSPRSAEHLLQKMADGLRVRMEVDDNGLIGDSMANPHTAPGSTYTHHEHSKPGSNITTVLFDRTGTLTKGRFEVSDVLIHQDEYDERKILYFAAAVEQSRSIRSPEGS